MPIASGPKMTLKTNRPATPNRTATPAIDPADSAYRTRGAGATAGGGASCPAVGPETVGPETVGSAGRAATRGAPRVVGWCIVISSQRFLTSTCRRRYGTPNAASQMTKATPAARYSGPLTKAAVPKTNPAAIQST